MNNSQLLKGILEGCVLLIISQEEVYGYQLVQLLKNSGFTEIVGGTVYPLLQKLERNGQLQSKMKTSHEGPDRKYYTLTEDGEKSATLFNEEWTTLKTNVDEIIKNTRGENYA